MTLHRILLTLAAALVLASASTVAAAATFQVTKTEDTNDGACDADCSLREAVEAANALAGPDTISIPAGTYLLGRGLVLSSDVVIEGAGPATTIIDGSNIGLSLGGGVFTITGGDANLEISNVTIRGGSGLAGGAIANGRPFPGQEEGSIVTVRNSTLTGQFGDRT